MVAFNPPRMPVRNVRCRLQLPSDSRTQEARRDARHRTTGGGVRRPIPSSTGIQMRSLAGWELRAKTGFSPLV